MADEHTVAPADSPRELVACWKAAEERLALLAVGDPDLYVHHLQVLGRITGLLRRYVDIEGLSAAYADYESILAPLTGGEAGEVDVPSLAGAAWMVRYRQLVGERHRQLIATRISDARRRGVAWVTISETGPAPPSSLSYPYEHMTMRIADGAGIRAAIDIDPVTYGPVYRADVLRFDPATGLPLAVTGPGRRETFADRASWEKGVAALRAQLDAGATGLES